MKIEWRRGIGTSYLAEPGNVKLTVAQYDTSWRLYGWANDNSTQLISISGLESFEACDRAALAILPGLKGWKE